MSRLSGLSISMPLYWATCLGFYCDTNILPGRLVLCVLYLTFTCIGFSSFTLFYILLFTCCIVCCFVSLVV